MLSSTLLTTLADEDPSHGNYYYHKLLMLHAK